MMLTIKSWIKAVARGLRDAGEEPKLTRSELALALRQGGDPEQAVAMLLSRRRHIDGVRAKRRARLWAEAQQLKLF